MNTPKSHFCCWEQKQPPACNIPLEDHKQCCLCDKATPKKEESKGCNNCDETRTGMLVPCADCKQNTCIGCAFRRPDDYLCRWCRGSVNSPSTETEQKECTCGSFPLCDIRCPARKPFKPLDISKLNELAKETPYYKEAHPEEIASPIQQDWEETAIWHKVKALAKDEIVMTRNDVMNVVSSAEEKARVEERNRIKSEISNYISQKPALPFNFQKTMEIIDDDNINLSE